VGDGADEGGHGVDGEEEEFADAKEPDAEAKGVAAAVGEEDDHGPDEVELLFDGQGPEVVEREGGGGLKGVAGQVGEVLKEEDEDQQRFKLQEVSSGEQAGDGGGQQGGDVEGKDAESAAGVEVTQAVQGAVGFPKAAGDEEAGEGEEENDAAPAELGKVAEEALGGVGGLETAAVVKDEDEEDGEAAEAVEGRVASSFGDGGGGSGAGARRTSGRRFEGFFFESCVGSHLAQRRGLAVVRQ